jgi:hypothetical protein
VVGRCWRSSLSGWPGNVQIDDVRRIDILEGEAYGLCLEVWGEMGAVSDQMVPTCAVGTGDGDNDRLGERFPRGKTVLVVTVGLSVC